MIMMKNVMTCIDYVYMYTIQEQKHTCIPSYRYRPTYILRLLHDYYIHKYAYIYSSFIQTISIAPLQAHFYSEALPTQHGYCAGVSRRSATGNSELRNCPRSIRDG